MASKQQIMSYIERTNNLLKSSSKSNFQSTSLSQPNPSSPVKRVAKVISQSISVMPLQSPKSASSKTLKTSLHKDLDQNDETLVKSSLDFVKNLNHALDDLLNISELKAKKALEIMSKEAQALNSAKNIIEEHKKVVNSIPQAGVIERYEKNLRFFAKETAEELSNLEKKCKDIEDENINMKKYLGICGNSGKDGKSVDYVLKICSEKDGDNDENVAKGLKDGEITGKYSKGVDEICGKWAQELVDESFGVVLKSLSNVIIIENQSWQKAKDNITDRITKMRGYKIQLEDKIMDKKLQNFE
jgi:hypothetical protein